jgi:hypothetical protein
MSGDPISSVTPGEDFKLQAKVSDLRVYPDGFESWYPSTAPVGTFASYSDVTFDSDLVAPDGGVSYGPLFTFLQKPDDIVFANPGVLDEIGSVADFSTFFVGMPSPALLFSVPFQANAAGEVNFTLDPADDLPFDDSLLFGLDGAVPVDKIDFVNCSIQVGNPNTPPIANPDAITVAANSSVTFDALADNGSGPDSDPDGDPLTITGFTQPSSGALLQNPNGTFTYTPASGFSGTDSFSYTIADGRGGSASGTVTLTVLSAQDQILLLTQEVTGLVNSGVLTAGVGNALISKLDAALQSINNGHTNAGDNQVSAFIHQINALVNSGTLTDDQAESLIAAADQIIASTLG